MDNGGIVSQFVVALIIIIPTLGFALRTLSQTINTQNSQITNLTGKVKDLEDKHIAFAEERGGLTAQINMLKERVRDAEAAQRDANNKSIEEVAASKEIARQLKEQLDSVTEKLSKLDSDFKAVAGERDAKVTELKLVRGDLDVSNEKVASLEKELETLRQKYTEIENLLRAEQGNNQTLRERLTQTEREIAAKEAEMKRINMERYGEETPPTKPKTPPDEDPLETAKE